jgi:hypothetical protein
MLTEKVNEVVKIEVEARFKADTENQAFANTMAQKVVQEIDMIRKEFDESFGQLSSTSSMNSKECSDRANNLSKYIDSAIAKSGDLFAGKYDSLKKFISKLTDQVKSHIDYHDSKMIEIETQIDEKVSIMKVL